MSAGATAADTISVTSQHPFTLTGHAAATHDLALHVYAFSGTQWTGEDILPAIEGAARLVGKCGVALRGGELRTLDAPRAYHDYSTAMSRELLRRIEVPRPAVFFVQDTRNRPAYDAEAIGLANARSRPELANTVWVAHGARDLPYALAHELVHMLSDSGAHSDEPGNLMQPKTSPRNTQLSAAQCRRLLERGEANGLLKRRAP